MDIHETYPTVMVTDTKTGNTINVSHISVWDWTEGNWSCDCNRAAFFDNESEGGCVARRYKVTNVSPMPESYTLEEFNADYEDEV